MALWKVVGYWLDFVMIEGIYFVDVGGRSKCIG